MSQITAEMWHLPHCRFQDMTLGEGILFLESKLRRKLAIYSLLIEIYFTK